MRTVTLHHASLFSLEDVEELCNSVGKWATDRTLCGGAPPWDLDAQGDQKQQPRFSRCELVTAVEAVLDEIIVDAMD